MEFDKFYMIKVTKKQAGALVAALESYIRRMNRDYYHKQRVAQYEAEMGNTAEVEAIVEAFPARRKRIDAAYQLRDYIRDTVMNDNNGEKQ